MFVGQNRVGGEVVVCRAKATPLSGNSPKPRFVRASGNGVAKVGTGTCLQHILTAVFQVPVPPPETALHSNNPHSHPLVIHHGWIDLGNPFFLISDMGETKHRVDSLGFNLLRTQVRVCDSEDGLEAPERPGFINSMQNRE